MKFDLKRNRKLTFADVRVGEVFVADVGFVCMKIKRIEPKLGKPINCVFLLDGSCGLYEENGSITRIIKNAVLREEE